MQNKFKKSICTLGVALMLSSVVPAVSSAQEATPELSDWAVETLIEGEKYGIFPIDWYTKDFQKPITKKRLNTLFELTEAKIAALELPKNKAFTPAPVKKNSTRGDIINRLYNIVAQYDVNAGTDPVKYLQERNVLRGSQNGLMLKQRATTEQAVIFAIRLIQDTYMHADAGGKGVAWVVKDEDTTLYLLGSIHYGITDLYPMNHKLTTAFNESDGLFVEIDLVNPRSTEIYLENAFYSDGKTVREDISEEAYAKLEQVATKLDIPIENLEMLKPWSILNTLTSLTMDGAYGISLEEMGKYSVDMQFLTNAYLQQKPVYELEGMQAQMNMFNGLSSETQEEELVSLIDAILNPVEVVDEDEDILADWFEYWRLGDVDNFAISMAELNGEDEFNKMLFGQRDEDMANSLIEVLENEPGEFFVVVGAGHFLVENNIRYHLEQHDYEVKPFYE